MAAKLSTGFMRAPTYKSSLDTNHSAVGVPSVFDSLNKYSTIKPTVLGEYKTYTPEPVEEPRKKYTDNKYISDHEATQSFLKSQEGGAWDAIKYSTVKGFVDYAADATDFVLEKIQEAKTLSTYSKEEITGKSADSVRQALLSKYFEADAKATTRAEKIAARNEFYIEWDKVRTEATYGVKANEQDYAGFAPKLSKARKDVQAFFAPKLAELTRRADVENEGWFTQTVASAAESAPYTLASKLSLAGFFLNYGVQEQRSIQEKTAIAQAEGRELSLEDKQNILMNAVGGAIVEAASEHIFPAGAGALGKATIKSLAKFVVVQGLQEGAEEVLSYIGQGFLAKLTTDKTATLFGVAESSGALINLAGAGKSALAGAIMGAVYSGVGGTIGYAKTKAATRKHADKIVEEITPENIQEVEEAIKTDAQDQDNVDELFADLSAVTVKINQDLPIENQAQNLETAVASLQEKSKNQVLQPAEKANTDAVIQVAETELKNLRTQQREAILQSPVQAPTSPSAVEGTSISTPAVETPPQPSGEVPRPQQAPAEDGKISLDNAEVISDKSSTGTVYRIGDKVYKSGLFVGLPGRRIETGRPTLEAEAYEALQDSDVVAKGRSVEIDGKPYIELPYFERIVSTDEVAQADREMYQPIIQENIDRIIQSVQDLSNAGYNYSDPLQFGYDGDNLYLIDFSNVMKGEPNEVLNENYNRLGNFFKEFGFEKMDYIISRGMELRRNLETLVYEGESKEDYDLFLKFTPEAIRDTVDELKKSRGDMPPNNVYYATNGRGIQIGNIMQTDRIDGVKHIFSETPLDPKVVADWEMKPIYEGILPSARTKRKRTVQQPSAVTQEPTGASGNIDLRVESYEAEKQVFVAKKKNAKIAQTYLNNIKAKYNAEVDDAQELLQAYKDIERSDYESVEDYNDERESAWEEFIDAVDNIELEEIEQPTQQAQPKAETKVEQERATASETIAQESQKQDRSGIEGIVAPGTVAAMGNVPVQAKKQSWQDTISAETKQRFEDSSTPIDKEPIKERLSRWKEMFREYVTLGSVPIPVEMGDLRVEFRKMRTAFAQAKMKATRIIELSYNQVGKERFDLMSKAILYLDINEDLKKGLYNQGSAMQFGIKSPQEAIATIRAIVQEIRKPENQVVMDALKTRRRMMDSIRNDLLTQARKAGVDLELINNRKDYMYHAVIAYQQDFNRMAKSKKGKKRVEYLGRTGSIQDYVSDPVFSDYIIIGKMVSDTYRLRLFNEIKKQDISSTLKQAPTGEYIIPDGYSEMDVAMLGMPRLDHYSKQLIVRNASINLANLGIQKGSQAWNAAMKSAYAQANKNNVVVPESVVKAIEYEFGKKERYVGRSMKFVMNAWKYSKLRLPNVVIRYNIRNLMGDLDAMVIGNPVAMLKIPKAVTELYKFYYKKGVLTPALADFVESTGLVTGQTAQELKTLKSHSSFEFYDKSKKPADVVKRGVKKAWSVLTMETATDFREQILRYAAYLEFLEQVKRSKTGTLKNYAMSIPAEIDSITDVKEKAAKLANDMIGAYDDVSIFGQYAADHLMPFFRFKEINIKRYYRLTKNMFYTSPEVLQDVGTGIAGSLGKAGRVGAFTLMKMAKVAISVSLFYGALQLFNNLMSPEEEDKLPEDVKKRPHITLPAWLVGPNRVYYIDRLGSLAELLDIFGIDRSLGSDLNDVITGRMKLEDKMKEMLMSPVHDIFNSSFPLAKMSVELITGKELFPDPSNPKQMRDRWEYIFNQVGFRDEYKALAGKPIIEGSYTKQKRSIIFSSVVPGDAAYWDVYNMTDDFYKRHDISQRSSSWSDPSSKDAKKANAAYYYKVALKMQDTKAAERYLKEYVFYGGTKSTFESTMRSMAPLHWMSKTDKKLFFSEMTAQEKEQYDKAVAYFEELMKIKATSLP